MTKKMNAPVLRFPDFEGAWELKKLQDLATFSKGKGISKSDISADGDLECIRYGELYTHYSEVINDVKSKTNLDPGSLVLSEKNDVIIPASGEDALDIATASCVLKEGVALGGDLNIIRAKLNGVFLSYYLNNKKKIEIARLAQGISVIHLYSKQLKLLKVLFPKKEEQQKITTFLTAIDTKIQQLKKKKALLVAYKKGVIQKIFKQEIRFKNEEGKDFEEWKERNLSEVLFEHKLKKGGDEKVFSVSVHKGLVNQIEHLGRSFSAKNTDHYNRVKPYDIVYTKSPTGDFPYGTIKQSRVEVDVIVSPLYGVFTPETPSLGYILDEYFLSKINVHNYLHPIIQKGAKNTINITNKTFLSKSLKLPTSKKEQIRIADFLKSINKSIDEVDSQCSDVSDFKKGLLQKMFV